MEEHIPMTMLRMDGPLLARFMPLHMVLGLDGVVQSVGPTLSRILPDQALVGARFEDLFEVKSPGGALTVAEVLARAGHRFRLVPRHGPRIGLRGLGMVLPDGEAVLLNLSFGIDLIEAVREFGLTDGDFAATDLAMEMLYLAEANAAVTRELRGLNLRLEGARLAAEEESLTDPLTGLRNRRAADLFLERLCAVKASFGLLHMDLDFFKTVNDTLGHAAGDQVLAQVGQVLRGQTRAEDCAARIGGDEFVVILAERTDPAMLQAIAERIIRMVSLPIAFDGQVCQISASIGIVRSTDYAAPEAAVMVADADRALYAAKHAGRRRAVVFQSDAVPLD